MAYYNPTQEQTQVQYPANIVYYAAPAITYQQAGTKHFGLHYEKQTSTGLGATQVILACFSIAAGVMAIVYDAECYYIGIGIWAGVFYLIGGSLAIAAGKDPTNSLITATLVFSVFNFLIGIAHLTIASIGISTDLNCYSYYNYHHYCPNWWGGAIAANSMMIAAGSLEIIFSLCMMVVSARAIDKGSKQQINPMPVTYAPHQQGTVFIQANSAIQPQPLQPPPYYVQQQYPSTSNPQQMMHVGVHQAPSMTDKF